MRPTNAGAARPSESGRAFTEVGAWRVVGGGWRPLFGSFHGLGVSFEWHDFQRAEATDWGASFHPGSVEVCLNVEGRGWLEAGDRRVELGSGGMVFYRQGTTPLAAARVGGDRHRFITVEYSNDFLGRHLEGRVGDLHPVVAGLVEAGRGDGSALGEVEAMSAGLLTLVESLRRCPVFKPAQEMWFYSKALEVASLLFFRPAEAEMFCTRQQRAVRERVARIRAILEERLEEPPSLEELGRMVGCSPSHLSRQFSDETGMTIQQCLRRLRLERAAALLRTGQCNVTEAAMQVGYSSLSHFTVAFREQFGCCPGLYPLGVERGAMGGR